jgi:hypothetical protein
VLDDQGAEPVVLAAGQPQPQPVAASPASTTDTITENASAIHAAMASRGARSGQPARASTGAPAVSSSTA